MHKAESVLENETHKNFWDFQEERIVIFVLIDKKKRTCRRVDFADLADYYVKKKESNKIDKYKDLA